mgnify:CR=1 FL=1
MGTWIITIENNLETVFFKTIEEKFGSKADVIEPILEKLLKEWVEKNKIEVRMEQPNFFHK